MPANLYEILSLAMRYWFALLGVLIILRAYVWLVHDRSDQHRRRRSLPDAGCVGELLVLSGSDELPADASVPVLWEGTLGFVRGCDMVIPVPGVAHTHLYCTFEEGKGLYVEPRRGCSCLVDGEEVYDRRSAKQHPLRHGSVLEVGSARLQLRVFIGIDVERVAAVAEDIAPPVILQPVQQPVYVQVQPVRPQYPEVLPVEPQPPVCLNPNDSMYISGTNGLPVLNAVNDDPYLWAPPVSPAALPEVILPGEGNNDRFRRPAAEPCEAAERADAPEEFPEPLPEQTEQAAEKLPPRRRRRRD